MEMIQEAGAEGGREVTGRRGTHPQTQPASYFSLFREKHWQEFGLLYSLTGLLYSLTGNRHLCEFSQPNSLFSPAVSTHLQGGKTCETVVLTFPHLRVAVSLIHG